MNKKTKKILLSGALIASNFSVAFATKNQYAEKMGKWILDGIYWIVLVVGIFLGGLALLKRNLLAGIGILLATAIVITIISEPTILKTLGTTLKGIIGL